MSDWRFSIPGAGWETAVDAVSTEERKGAFWELAVPRLAAHEGWSPPQPCVVVCHVRSPGPPGRPPGGPLGRVKGLLDALHDDRRSGPKYRELGKRAPLPDDHPEHVSGLAVEVRPGAPRTDYQLGDELAVSGELLASVPVPVAAPNDIAGTPSETTKIAAARLAYGRAVREAFVPQRDLPERNPLAVVVRHRPQRDEDNTWATWIAAVCGTRGRAVEHWAAGAPLIGWSPSSIASLGDSSLDTPVVYELWG